MVLNGIFGPITKPIHITKTLEQEGLINLLSNIIKLITLVAGITAFFNLIFAGFEYITSSGDTEKAVKALQKIWNSLIGLVIIASAFTIIAILSKIIFGTWDAILNPTIYGPGPQ